MIINNLKCDSSLNSRYITFPAFLLLILLLPSCLFSKIDRTPYQQTGFYKKYRQTLDTLTFPAADGNAVKAGWAKINITPIHRVRLAGYGTRFAKKSSGIHDSVYIRAFVFDNGKTKAAFITSDLLIMPPEVIKKLTPRLPEKGWHINQIYFSATHTHNSLGGWARHLSGSLIAGKHRRKVVKSLATSFLDVLSKAEQNIRPAAFAFAKTPAAEFVNNRLSDTLKFRDTLIRSIFIRQNTGKTAVITTFQAHPTCLEDKVMPVSGDYPATLVNNLEKDFDFAAFAAGGVGSHSPNSEGQNFDKIAHIANGLHHKIMDSYAALTFSKIKTLRILQMPLYLRKPVWRPLNNMNKAVKPWLFNLLFGKYKSKISFLQLGDVYLTGMPCDFSGLLTLPMQEEVAKSGKELIVTSFNGGYIGYITPDNFYDIRHYETKDMNWFGPENGAYFSEIVLNILRKF